MVRIDQVLASGSSEWHKSSMSGDYVEYQKRGRSMFQHKSCWRCPRLGSGTVTEGTIRFLAKRPLLNSPYRNTALRPTDTGCAGDPAAACVAVGVVSKAALKEVDHPDAEYFTHFLFSKYRLDIESSNAEIL